jgi:hypothetical protein
VATRPRSVVGSHAKSRHVGRRRTQEGEHMQQQGRGIRAEEIRGGTMINGRRVVAMTTGMTGSGQRTTTVRFAGFNRKGKPRLSDPVTYVHGTWVDGTRTPTTWAMPAGPVGRQPGTKLNGGWFGDPDASDRGSRADRHQRKIESITYAAA